MKTFRIFICLIALSVSSAFAIDKIGLDFNAGSTSLVSCNLRISHLLEIKPGISFIGDSQFGAQCALNFYLNDIKELQNYIGIGVGSSDLSAGSDNGFIFGHYGLRYDVNEVISTFGEIGISTSFDTNSFGTFTSGLGLTFYFPL